jgi:hypothetical protein
VPVEVELLVVPDDVPPVVSEGTPPVRLGTPPGRLGTPLDKVGTPPGSAGTAGTLGPVALVVPAGGVTTVVTPEAVVGGITTTGVRPAGAPVAVEGVVVGVVVLPEDAGVPPPVTTRGEPPSGRTQFTSRLEQKSGMVVRSVESAATAMFESDVADSAAKAADTAVKAIRRCMVAPSGRCSRDAANGGPAQERRNRHAAVILPRSDARTPAKP